MILNRFKLGSKLKIIINIMFITSKHIDLITTFELLIFYVSLLYLIVNIYLIRHSSLRIEILKRTHEKKQSQQN
jgi:hypothetical protein